MIQEQLDLPIIEPFKNGLEHFINIDNPYKAILQVVIDKENVDKINEDIEKNLKQDPITNLWKQRALNDFSQNMANYQNSNADYDIDDLDDEINRIGMIIPHGQYLFHGGSLDIEKKGVKVLDKPFPTSISPIVAFDLAVDGCKFFGNKTINIFVLAVCNSTTKATILFQNNAVLNHEYEVLFAAGLELDIVGKIIIDENFEIENKEGNKIKILVSIIFCNIT